MKSDVRVASMSQSTNAWDIRLGEWASIEVVNNTPDSCYPKLEPLSVCDEIIIIRQLKLYNRDNDENRYLIGDKDGKNLYYAVEKCVQCDYCGGNRSFNLSFYDRNKTLALYLEKPFRFGSCCIFFCCLQYIAVKGNNKQVIGKVKEKYNLFLLNVEITDESKTVTLKVVGPTCVSSFVENNTHFDIHCKDNNESKCGHICKKSDIIVGGHVFRTSFSVDLDVKLKACMIEATILIDYYYYEQPIHQHKYDRWTMARSESLTPFSSWRQLQKEIIEAMRE